MAEARIPNLTIRNANLRYRNFEGKPTLFNASGGVRSFCVFLDEKLADYMEKQGWNVKRTKQREEGEGNEPYVEVAVQYDKGRPPRVVMINSTGAVDLGADEVSILDWATIEQADIVLNPYPYTVNGRSGIKAYLKTAFITIYEDELEKEYAQVDPNQSAAVRSIDEADED